MVISLPYNFSVRFSTIRNHYLKKIKISFMTFKAIATNQHFGYNPTCRTAEVTVCHFGVDSCLCMSSAVMYPFVSLSISQLFLSINSTTGSDHFYVPAF